MEFRETGSLAVMIAFSLLLLGSLSQALAQAESSLSVHDRTVEVSSPFSEALETLQKKLNYTFRDVELLRQALTHSSFSKENNAALGIMGASVIESSVSFRALSIDVEMSPKDLNRRIAEAAKVETSCAVDGMRLGLQKLVRVSPKTDPSTPSVVCGAFRALFGAMLIDTGKDSAAGDVFWRVHSKNMAESFAM